MKRSDPDASEEVILYRTMLDLIKPKLVYLDLPLFMALLSDLFPGVELPAADAGVLRTAIEQDLREAGLQVCARVAVVRAGKGAPRLALVRHSCVSFGHAHVCSSQHCHSPHSNCVFVSCLIAACCAAAMLQQPVPEFVTKIIQIHDCKVARHGNMIVGKTGSGKTEAWKCLQRTLGKLKAAYPEVDSFQRVHVYTINPLALSNDELYGSFEEVRLM